MTLRFLTAAALAAAVISTSLLASPASAAPPVTVDDHITMWAGANRSVDVLANDSDPDGDELTVCRVGEVSSSGAYVSVGFNGASIDVYLFGDVGDAVTITYYACDYDTLVPATLTINVKTAEPIQVTKIDKPGVLRVTNPNDRQVRFLWGNAKERRPDGRVHVPAHDSVFVRVHRHRIIWAAMLGRFTLAGFGHVRDIELPKDDRGTAALRQRGQLPLWPKGVQLLG